MVHETGSGKELLRAAVASIRALRADGAIVHCITNTVAQNFTANVLLACGATPSMTVSPAEVEAFSSRADAVLINIGTLDEDRKEAIRISLDTCQELGKPFVLDPVMCHVSPVRLAMALEISARHPAILRANPLEAKALGYANRALNRATILAMTGAVDTVWEGSKCIEIHNGHPFLSKVTAVGCAQGGLMAALLTVSSSPFVAAVAALVCTGIAGEKAAAFANGPGSFQHHFIDQLYAVTLDELHDKARLT